MKFTFNQRFTTKLLALITAITFNYNELNAQAVPMWSPLKTLPIGGKVYAVELFSSNNNTVPLVALGVESNLRAWVEVRNINTGQVQNKFTFNARPNAISASRDNNYLAIGTNYGAYVQNLQNNVLHYLNRPTSSPITDIYWDDVSFPNQKVIITSDMDGNISFFNYDSTQTYITPFKTIPYPTNPNIQYPHPMIDNFSVNNNNNTITAGYLNQVVSWNVLDTMRKFQYYIAPGWNGYGRRSYVESIFDPNGNYILSVDNDSIQAMDSDGLLLYELPFIDDSPTGITYGVSNFPFVVISTSYDRCLVYSLKNRLPVLIGNFSTHTNTVSSVAVKSVAANLYMISGSLDQTIEIWTYNSGYNPDAR